MTINSYGLIEHFDYMTHFVPQPFELQCNDINCIVRDADENYIIKTTKGDYTLSTCALRKLVDTLGIKIKLLSYVASETDVFELALPIINKLFKCFANCFVFYAKQDDQFAIIDLNANNEKGEAETIYENGPSPWKLDISSNKAQYTCFADFKSKYSIAENDTDILVKADDIMNGSKVSICLFKNITTDSQLQPMLTFSSKFSSMNGFLEILPSLFDEQTGISIEFPMNYAKHEYSFDEMWEKVVHLCKNTDLNDFIFREINELAASSETPSALQNFIADLLVSSVVNMNQPIKNILSETVTATAEMKPAKRKKFIKQLGRLIAFALCMKHSGCEHCGHLEIN